MSRADKLQWLCQTRTSAGWLAAEHLGARPVAAPQSHGLRAVPVAKLARPAATAAAASGPGTSSANGSKRKSGQLRRKAPSTPAASAGAAEPTTVPEVQEWDLVVYRLSDGNPASSTSSGGGEPALGLGHVTAVESGSARGTGAAGSASATVTLQPLRQEPDGSWLEAGGGELTLPLGAVVRAVAHTYGQRVDPDRVANPHGEHAHDVWQVAELLPTGVWRG